MTKPRSLSYGNINNRYVFHNSFGTPSRYYWTANKIAKRENELRKAGWVVLPGTFTLDNPQREIVEVKPGAETTEHLVRLIRFLATKHEKATGTPYTMYAHLNVSANTKDEDGSGVVEINTTFTSDPEGKHNIGVSMTTYLDEPWELSTKEWLKMDSKTYPIGTPIWSDWHKDIEILINPKRGK